IFSSSASKNTRHFACKDGYRFKNSCHAAYDERNANVFSA
ncbi:MAG: hypothetical protein JWN40_2997, partial [Phycisphaerales bacterium]|nr:hypothetical protein [Phycisphaerales bacterium]